MNTVKFWLEPALVLPLVFHNSFLKFPTNNIEGFWKYLDEDN